MTTIAAPGRTRASARATAQLGTERAGLFGHATVILDTNLQQSLPASRRAEMVLNDTPLGFAAELARKAKRTSGSSY
jgi:hypothetical protein